MKDSPLAVEIFQTLFCSLFVEDNNTMVIRSNIRAIYKCFYLWKIIPMAEIDAKAFINAVLSITATTSDAETRLAAMAIMVELAGLYYHYLPPYLESICDVYFHFYSLSSSSSISKLS